MNELDYFVKHDLKIKHYIRYVDDFVVFCSSGRKLEKWFSEINSFLQKTLRIELHPEKSRIVSVYRGVDFVGFRNFSYYRLLRKRNQRSVFSKIEKFEKGNLSFSELFESILGWEAYSIWANSFYLRRRVRDEVLDAVLRSV